MKLKPIHSLPSMKLAGRVPGDLRADLIAYSEYYREVFSEPIALWPLVVQILGTLMDEDRAFRAWRHRRADAELERQRQRGRER